MGIVERLGSRERLLAALKLAFDDHLLRSLAEAHQVIVPGFRPAQAPASLLARSMATDCWRNSGLRTDLDQALSRLARPGDALVDGVDADRAVAELATLPDQPRARAVSVLLRSVDDARTPVRDAALVALDRLDAGEIHLAPPVSPPTRPPVADRGRTDRPPVHDERLRDREEARRALAERDRQLRQLRDESTQQELKLQRLRAQLEAERESHERTRKALSEARDAARAAAGGGGGRELKDARKDALGARAEQAKTKTQLDALLRDYSLLQSGVRALEEVVEALLADHGDTPPAPVRPHKPSRTIDLPPEAKLRLPSSEHHWPRHFRVFVERLAGSPYIERIQPLDFSGATSSRISLEIPDTTLIAQYSDGDRAARFLIQTTATTPGSLHWVRRHLTETYFSSV